MLVGRSGRPHTDNPLSDLMQRLAAPPPPVRTVVARGPRAGGADHHALPADRSGRALRERCSARGGARRARRQRQPEARPEPAPRRQTAPSQARRRLADTRCRRSIVLGVAAGAWFAARRTVDARRTGAHAAGLGADRGLPERTGRPDLRSHAGAGAEARARGRGLHQRLRPAGDRAQPRRASARTSWTSGRRLEIAVKQGVGIVLSGALAARAALRRVGQGRRARSPAT